MKDRSIDLKKLSVISKKCRYDIVRMIANANSGHIGGSFSSIDIYVFLLSVMKPEDRLIISHGHSSPAVYAALGNFGYFDVENAVFDFRQNPPFEGHPSIEVEGVEWCSGVLGQGLSVGCGFAIAKKIKNEPGRVFVVMGDGEQQKGQLQEAREFAAKFKLDNLIAIVDANGLQASGDTGTISGQSLEAKYFASGWAVTEVYGHSFEELQKAVRRNEGPLCILAKTVMGKGIPEIENDYNYHGNLLPYELKELSLERFKLSCEEEKLIENMEKRKMRRYEPVTVEAKKGRRYEVSEYVDIRSALGNALHDIAKENRDVPIAALDCDLEASVKLSAFKKLRPDSFVECGIAEHNAATVAAAISKSGSIAVHADFSVFNIAETYSQNRMADINKAPVKLFCTHAGLDVGEDGKTHQCTDYLSLLSNLHGFRVLVPADANQADAAVRYAMSVPKPVAIIGGRSKLPVLTDENGEKLGFEYGKEDWLRRGKNGVIITYGNMVHRAVKVADELENEGVSVGVLNLPTPCEIDEAAVTEAAKTGLVITYEDHNLKTGIAGSIARIICENALPCKLKSFGIKMYGASKSAERLYRDHGLSEENIKDEIKKLIK